MVLNTPLSVKNVRDTLQENTLKLSKLCKSSNINIWSGHKPTNFGYLLTNPASEEDFRVSKYGIDYSTSNINSPSSNTLGDVYNRAVINQNGQWKLNDIYKSAVPECGFRLRDFDKYDNEATFPFKVTADKLNFEGYKITADTNINITNICKTGLKFNFALPEERLDRFKFGVIYRDSHSLPDEPPNVIWSDTFVEDLENSELQTKVSIPIHLRKGSTKAVAILGRPDTVEDSKYIYLHNGILDFSVTHTPINIWLTMNPKLSDVEKSKLKYFYPNINEDGYIVGFSQNCYFDYRYNPEQKVPELQATTYPFYKVKLYNKNGLAKDFDFPINPSSYSQNIVEYKNIQDKFDFRIANQSSCDFKTHASYFGNDIIKVDLEVALNNKKDTTGKFIIDMNASNYKFTFNNTDRNYNVLFKNVSTEFPYLGIDIYENGSNTSLSPFYSSQDGGWSLSRNNPILLRRNSGSTFTIGTYATAWKSNSANDCYTISDTPIWDGNDYFLYNMRITIKKIDGSDESFNVLNGGFLLDTNIGTVEDTFVVEITAWTSAVQ